MSDSYFTLRAAAGDTACDKAGSAMSTPNTNRQTKTSQRRPKGCGGPEFIRSGEWPIDGAAQLRGSWPVRSYVRKTDTYANTSPDAGRTKLMKSNGSQALCVTPDRGARIGTRASARVGCFTWGLSIALPAQQQATPP